MCNLVKATSLSVLLLSAVTGAVQAAEYSAGGTFGSQGFGVAVDKKSELHLRSGDQIQWRVFTSGLISDDVDDIELNNKDYTVDFDSKTLSVGASWYPFAEGFSSNLFVAGGLSYMDLSIKGTTEDNQAFSVDGVQVGSGDGVGLRTDIDHSTVAPYLSLGWGNRIREDRGLSYFVEVGVFQSLSDADVTVEEVGAGMAFTQQNLANERRDIEDDVNGTNGFISVAVTYHF
jgi:hypothetical protein